VILTAIGVAGAAGYFGAGLEEKLPLPNGVQLVASTGADTIAGRASVIDGDTVEIHGARIRFNGIDAPESTQLCTDAGGRTYQCRARSAEALAEWLSASSPRPARSSCAVNMADLSATALVRTARAFRDGLSATDTPWIGRAVRMARSQRTIGGQSRKDQYLAGKVPAAMGMASQAARATATTTRASAI